MVIDQVLKFHEKDTRVEYYKQWQDKINVFRIPFRVRNLLPISP